MTWPLVQAVKLKKKGLAKCMWPDCAPVHGQAECLYSVHDQTVVLYMARQYSCTWPDSIPVHGQTVFLYMAR